MSGKASESTSGSGGTGSAVATGAMSGAAMGTSVVPGWGTAIGAVVGAGASLFQASEQAKAQREFQEKQDKAMEEAKRLAGANFLKNVGVPFAGELAGMKANTAGYKQALEAAVEGDWRNLPGVVGRIDESMVDANAQQAVRVDDKIYKLKVAQAQEQKDSSNALAGIALGEASGFGLAKQQAEKAKIAAYTSAAQGAAQLGQLWDASRALYPQDEEAADQGKKVNEDRIAFFDQNGMSPNSNRGRRSEYDWSLFNN